VSYAQNISSAGSPTNGAADPTLDRSYEYDQVGRLVISHSGAEARAHVGTGQWGMQDGPYSQGYEYDVWGNLTHRYGWGGERFAQTNDITESFTNNQRNGFSYDAAGNLTNDLGQNFTYDATGQQATASYTGYSLQQYYDGNGLRVKKTDNGVNTYYLRSSVLGGQVVAEMNSSGVLGREYVYLGGQVLAVRSPTKGVLKTYWVHEDPVTKSKRITNNLGSVVSTIELDPWGADTTRSNNVAFQPKKFTSYERDGNDSDEATFRRSNRWHSRFDQPDPYNGSYDPSNPQSFNRYAYVRNDPVDFVDPTGLKDNVCLWIFDGDSDENQCFGEWQPDIGFEPKDGVPNDPEGKESENTAQQNARTTCERFADRVQDLANAATTIDGLLDALATTFLSMSNGHPTNGSISEVRAAQGATLVGEARTFSSNDGIRGRFRGVEGGGQIRHFVGANSSQLRWWLPGDDGSRRTW
jgi:RHS repeat-associated protein